MKQQSHRRIARAIAGGVPDTTDLEIPQPQAGRAVPATPLISILVTTYNRAICLESCLAQLTSQVALLPEGLVEIIVSDNHSTDQTASVADRYAARHAFLRRVMPDRHYPSAEENLFSGLPHCQGEYVWPCGDDDFLAPGTVARVIELVRPRQYGFYLLNSGYVSTDGAVLAERLIRMSCPTLVLNMVELVQAAGLITIVASFTSTVLRRSELMAVDHAKYLSISAIYAHVAVYIAAFADKPCLVVNEQWITLRAGTGLTAFRVLAGKTRSATYLPWSNGLGRLLRQLEQDGLVPGDLIFHTLECSGDGQFWTWANLLHIYTEQIQLSAFSDREEDAITPDLFLEFRSFFANSGPFVFEIFLRLERILRTVAVLREAGGQDCADARPTLGRLLALLPGEARERLCGMTRQRIRAGLQEVRAMLGARVWLRDLEAVPRLGRHGSYDLLRVGLWYYAIDRDAPRERLANLRPGSIDPMQNYPFWIAARNVDELREELSLRDLARFDGPEREYNGFRILRVPQGVAAVAEPLANLLNTDQLRSVARADLPELVLHAESATAVQLAIDTLRAGAPSGQPASVDMPTFNAEILTKYFDEAYYLQQYPDVGQRIDAGEVSSALQHFLRHGAEDDRCPCLFVDVAWYRSKHLADLALPPTTFPFAYLHYLTVGQRLRASPSPLFDEAWYLGRYPDVRAMVLAAEIESGFEHFYTRGRFEGFDPHESFSNTWYLQTYPKVAAYLAAQQDRRMCAYEHFLRIGLALKLQPHPSFSEEEYLRVNQDVRDGLERGLVGSGWMHWLWHGKSEGRRRFN